MLAVCSSLRIDIAEPRLRAKHRVLINGGLLCRLCVLVGSRLDVTVGVRRPKIVVVLQPSEAQQQLQARTYFASLNFVSSQLDSSSIDRKQNSKRGVFRMHMRI
jgi:hypothetical protein